MRDREVVLQLLCSVRSALVASLCTTFSLDARQRCAERSAPDKNGAPLAWQQTRRRRSAYASLPTSCVRLPPPKRWESAQASSCERDGSERGVGVVLAVAKKKRAC